MVSTYLEVNNGSQNNTRTSNDSIFTQGNLEKSMEIQKSEEQLKDIAIS